MGVDDILKKYSLKGFSPLSRDIHSFGVAFLFPLSQWSLYKCFDTSILAKI